MVLGMKSGTNTKPLSNMIDIEQPVNEDTVNTNNKLPRKPSVQYSVEFEISVRILSCPSLVPVLCWDAIRQRGYDEATIIENHILTGLLSEIAQRNTSLYKTERIQRELDRELSIRPNLPCPNTVADIQRSNILAAFSTMSRSVITRRYRQRKLSMQREACEVRMVLAFDIPRCDRSGPCLGTSIDGARSADQAFQ